MAEGITYVCDHCEKAIEAWSDRDPYYLDANGRKQYAHHPDHEELAKCIAVDSPHLCLDCGNRFPVDSRSPVTACPRCASENICDTFHLSGRQCPYCRTGSFTEDPFGRAIS